MQSESVTFHTMSVQPGETTQVSWAVMFDGAMTGTAIKRIHDTLKDSTVYEITTFDMGRGGYCWNEWRDVTDDELIRYGLENCKVKRGVLSTGC